MKEDSSWLTWSTGLAFGVVLGGSLTLAFAPALPVAVGVIATTTILWGAIGYLTEEYQKDNLKNSLAIPSSLSRQSSRREEIEGIKGTRDETPFSSLSSIRTSRKPSQDTSRRKLRFESEFTIPTLKTSRRLFGSPDSVRNSDDLHEFTFSEQPQWDATIFDTANNDQTTPQPPSMPPQKLPASSSHHLSASPIYMNTRPIAALVVGDIVSADFVCIPSKNTSQRDPRPVWMPDTHGHKKNSAIRIKAANIFESRRLMVSVSEHNPLEEVRLREDNPQTCIIRAAWHEMESKQRRLPNSKFIKTLKKTVSSPPSP